MNEKKAKWPAVHHQPSLATPQSRTHPPYAKIIFPTAPNASQNGVPGRALTSSCGVRPSMPTPIMVMNTAPRIDANDTTEKYDTMRIVRGTVHTSDTSSPTIVNTIVHAPWPVVTFSMMENVRMCEPIMNTAGQTP